MAATTAVDRSVATSSAGSRHNLMLVMSMLGFALNFWAWALLSPLGAHFKDALSLSSFDQALLVAVPVIVGSLGRMPVGALTDRFGGRLMFPLVSALSIIPVLFIGYAGYRSYAGLLIGGFCLGIEGHVVRGRRALRERLVPP